MIYIGTVVAIDPAGPLVNVPVLAPRAAFGPVPTLVPDLAVGERVAVSNLGNTTNALLILGRMDARAPDIGEIPGLAATLTSLDNRLDATEADDAADQLVLDNLGTRLSANESLDTTQNGRLTATEGVANVAASSAATANTAAGTAQTAANTANTGVTTLRADSVGKITTKGDLLIGTAAGVAARHGVPANGLALVGDSTQADGWAAKDLLGMPRALTGATTPTRFVGATATGAPTTGTFAVGDFVLDVVTGVTWTCTVAGSPGTWTNPGLSRPLGHMGLTNSFQSITSPGAVCAFSAAQVLRGGVTFSDAQDALVVPKTGLYKVTAKGYLTGSTNYQGQTYVTKNETALPPTAANTVLNMLTWKADTGDYASGLTELRTLTAGDVLRLVMLGASSTWGTDGYNGSFLEIEYQDQ